MLFVNNMTGFGGANIGNSWDGTITYHAQLEDTVASAPSTTFPAMAIGNAHADRSVFVCLASGGSDPNVSAVTVGGNSAKLIFSSRTDGGCKVQVWGIYLSTGTSEDIVVTHSTTSTYFNCATYSGVYVSLLPYATTDDINASPSITIDVLEGAGILAVMSSKAGMSDVLLTGVTLDYGGDFASDGWAVASQGELAAETPRTVSVDNKTNADQVLAVISLQEYIDFSQGLHYVGGKTIVYANAAAAVTSSLTNLSGGYEAAPVEGDLVIFTVQSAPGSGGGLANHTITSTGWTKIVDEEIFNSEGTNYAVAWKIMGATPDIDIEHTTSTSANDSAAVAIMVFRGGFNVTTPIGTVGVATNASSSLPNPPSVTTPTGDNWIIYGGGGSNTTNSTVFSSSDGDVFISQGASDTNDAVVGLGFRSTGGTLDPAQFTSNAGDSTLYTSAAFSTWINL